MQLAVPRARAAAVAVPVQVPAFLAVVVLAVAAGVLSATADSTHLAIAGAAVALAVVGCVVLARTGAFALIVVLALLAGLYTELTYPLYTPPITFSGVSVHYLDLLLLALAIAAIGRRAWSGPARVPEILLAAFIGWTVVVGMLRSLYLDLPFDVWSRELRSIAYFAFPLLVGRLIQNTDQLHGLGRWLLWTTVGVGTMAVAVRVLHDSIPYQTNLLIYRDEYGLRVFQVAGVERAMVGFAFAVGLLFATRRRWLWLIITANTATLIVALTRGAYLGVAGAIALMLVGMGRQVLPRLVFATLALGLLIVTSAAVLSAVSGEDVLTPFTGRLGTIDQLAAGEDTASVRIAEVRVVWSFMEEHPEALVLGQGLGGSYTDPYNELTAEIANLGDRRYAFVHNGYVWYVLRGGILASVLLYGFCITLMIACVRAAVHVREPYLRGTLLGVAGAIVSVLILSTAEAPVSEGLRMTAFLMFAGIGLAALRLVPEAANRT